VVFSASMILVVVNLLHSSVQGASYPYPGPYGSRRDWCLIILLLLTIAGEQPPSSVEVRVEDP
jgi:hypothetical protein